MSREIKDAKFWHGKIKELIGEKLDSVALINGEVESINTKEKLTREEISKVERLLGETLNLSEDPYVSPYVYVKRKP